MKKRSKQTESSVSKLSQFKKFELTNLKIILGGTHGPIDPPKLGTPKGGGPMN